VHAATDTIGNFLKVAHEANEKNLTNEATKVTDLCWSLLDYGFAVGEGVVEGVKNVGHMIEHPVETVIGIGEAAYNLAYVLCEYEAMGDVASLTGQQWAENTIEAQGHKINELEQVLNYKLSTTSGRDLVKAGAAVATEIWFTGKIAAAAKPLLDIAKARVVEVIKNVKPGVASEIALVGEIEIRIAAETYDHIALIQSDKAKQAASSASKAVTDTTQVEIKAGHAVQEVERAAIAPAVGEVKSAVKVDTKAIVETEAAKTSEVVLGKISSQNIEEAVQRIMSDKNKIYHIFGKPEHNFDRLLKIYKTQENVIRAVLTASRDKLPVKGVFEDLFIAVGEHIVCIRGNVIDEVPRIGTMFIT
jgi:hypothetical protein